MLFYYNDITKTRKKTVIFSAVGASSQCYWDELMLSKCLFNGNTYQNEVLLPLKCVEMVLNNSCLVSIILNKSVSFCIICGCGFLGA